MEDTNELMRSGTGRRSSPAEPAPPIQSRFLFVDVAALRAKQLRRGARAALRAEPGTPVPHKPERVAMEEVRRGLVHVRGARRRRPAARRTQS